MSAGLLRIPSASVLAMHALSRLLASEAPAGST